MSSHIPEEIHILHYMLYEFRKGSKATEATKNICGVYGDVLDIPNASVCSANSGQAMLTSRMTIVRDDRWSWTTISWGRRLSQTPVKQLAEKPNFSWSSVQEHLQHVGKVNIQGVWVPHQLSAENKAQRTTICNSLMTRQEREPSLHRIVTGDEKWVLYVNTKRKNQWLSPGQQPVPTAKPGLHPQKVLLSVWWDSVGIIHFEVLETGQTITADLYCQQLDRLH